MLCAVVLPAVVFGNGVIVATEESVVVEMMPLDESTLNDVVTMMVLIEVFEDAESERLQMVSTVRCNII